MVQGSRKRDLSIDDYLLRYQVGLQPVGCSAESAQPQGQRIPKGSKWLRGGKQLFSLSCEASSGVHTWAIVAIGSEYIQVWYVHGILPTRYHSSKTIGKAKENRRKSKNTARKARKTIGKTIGTIRKTIGKARTTIGTARKTIGKARKP